MTTYRLMDGVAGRPGVGSSGTQPPASPTPFTGAYQAALIFAASQVTWFQGFWWWVPTGGDTGSQKFALWSVNVVNNAVSAGKLITSVTSGTLTAGQFNFISLPTPVGLSQGVFNNTGGSGGWFVATTAWSSVNGFPDTLHQFGTGNPYVNGITNGPLSTFGGGSVPMLANFTWAGSAFAGSTFGTAGTDPTVTAPPLSTDSTYDNFWLDVQVSDTAPGGYAGPYNLWPNRGSGNNATVPDNATNYVIATEFVVSQPFTVSQIGYWSPAGTAQLATRASIWSIGSPATSGTEVIAVASPSWSGAAASGWVYCNTGSVTLLPAGRYKVSVYDGAATPDQWSGKDATTGFWATGEGTNGVTNGPLSAPNLATASIANKFQASGTEPGQNTFATGPPNMYPNVYVDALAQAYWVDVFVTPVPVVPLPSVLYKMRVS